MPGGVEQPGVLRPGLFPGKRFEGSNIASLGAMPIFEARHGCLDGRRRLFDLP